MPVQGQADRDAQTSGDQSHEGDRHHHHADHLPRCHAHHFEHRHITHFPPCRQEHRVEDAGHGDRREHAG